MLTSLAILIAFQTSGGLPPAPVFPAGCSPEFERVATLVEQSLQDGDFAVAAKRLALLPKLNPVLQWDDRKVPSGDRKAFADARDDAIQAWSSVIHDVSTSRVGKPPMAFSPTFGSQPDVKIGFEPELAPAPNDTAPAGVVTFASETVLPRIEAVIGLARGAEKRPISAMDVQNSVLYALGAYFGVASNPLIISVMGPHDAPSVKVNRFARNDMNVALANLEITETLRKAVRDHTRMLPSQASSFVDPSDLTHSAVLQGTIADLPLQLSNVGQGVLTYSLIPECGCIDPGPGGTLEPGESRLIHIAVDTREYTEAISKHVFLITNDPDHPTRRIPVTVPVTPRYQWIVPDGQVQVLGQKRRDVKAYLAIPPKYPVAVTGVNYAGAPGNAKIKPWSGTIADPETGEPAKPRSGYEVDLHLTGPLLPGRSSGTVAVQTLDPDFPEIRFTFYFQKGIVAMPDDLNLGMLGTAPKYANVWISRPGHPFKITSVKCVPKNLSATFKKVPSTDDYQVVLKFSGGAQRGDFVGTLQVYTNDPTQPRIDVPVHGVGG